MLETYTQWTTHGLYERMQTDMGQVRDIDLARDRLFEGRYALVIVKQGDLLFASKDRGIRPIYDALVQLGDNLKGASLADRVIGKAAAMFCVLAQVEAVYAELIPTRVWKSWIRQVSAWSTTRPALISSIETRMGCVR